MRKTIFYVIGGKEDTKKKLSIPTPGKLKKGDERVNDA